MTTALIDQPTATTRRDLTAHIQDAFVAVPVGGFLTVSQIANHVSTEYPAGVARPTGAVAARLNAHVCTVDGIRPDLHPETLARGAVKVVTFYTDGVRWDTAPVRPTSWA